jgi:hypothetical protein
MQSRAFAAANRLQTIKRVIAFTVGIVSREGTLP